MADAFLVCPMEVGESPKSEGLYHVSLETLQQSLHERWPQVIVTQFNDPISDSSCTWTMNLSGREFYCKLAKARDSLSIEGGSPTDYAIVAIWFRQLVPPQHRLSLFNADGYPEQLELTPQTTEKDVIRFIGRP